MEARQGETNPQHGFSEPADGNWKQGARTFMGPQNPKSRSGDKAAFSQARPTSGNDLESSARTITTPTSNAGLPRLPREDIPGPPRRNPRVRFDSPARCPPSTDTHRRERPRCRIHPVMCDGNDDFDPEPFLNLWGFPTGPPVDATRRFR